MGVKKVLPNDIVQEIIELSTVKNMSNLGISKYMTEKGYKMLDKFVNNLLLSNGVNTSLNKKVYKTPDDNDITFIVDYYKNTGRPAIQIEKIFSYKDNTVAKILKNNGYSKGSKFQPNIPSGEIIEKFNNGETIENLCKYYNSEFDIINRYLRQELKISTGVFSEVENKVIELYNEGKSKENIYNYVGISEITLSNILNKKLGVNKQQPNKVSNFNNNDVKFIIDKYESGEMTMLELGLHFGFTTSVAIRKVLDDNGILIKKRIQQYNKSVFTENDVLNIINDRIVNKLSCKAISEKYNCNIQPIIRILNENNISTSNLLEKRFTDEEELNVVNLYKDGISRRTISLDTEINVSAIDYILKKYNVNVIDSRIKTFTEDEINYITNKYSTNEESVFTLCKHFNTSFSTIYRVLTKNSILITDKNKINWTQNEIDEILDLYLVKKITPKQLALKYSVSGFSIRKVLDDNGVERNTNCNSSDEMFLRYLLKYFINTIEIDSVRSFIGNYEIDILCKTNKIGIEFNGIYYHTTDKKGDGYHKMKTNLMKEKGYKLIHIFEDEFNNNPVVVINKILDKFNYNFYIDGNDFNDLYECYLNDICYDEIHILPKKIEYFDNMKYFKINKVSNNDINKYFDNYIFSNKYGVINLNEYFKFNLNTSNYLINYKSEIVGFVTINDINRTIENLYFNPNFHLKYNDSFNKVINKIVNTYLEDIKTDVSVKIEFDLKWFSEDEVNNLFISPSKENIQYTPNRISYSSSCKRLIDKSLQEIDKKYYEIDDCGTLIYKI